MVKVVGGRNVTVSNRLENRTINLNENEFHEDLLPFKLNKFDIILGMDWLGENIVDILYRRKMGCINPPRREPFVVYGDNSRIKSRIIMIINAKKMPNQ